VLDKAADGKLSASVERAAGVKCERCWKYTLDVGSNPDLPTACAACAGAVAEMAQA
jgi:isoleucyl-tRNA synthetase